MAGAFADQQLPRGQRRAVELGDPAQLGRVVGKAGRTVTGARERAVVPAPGAGRRYLRCGTGGFRMSMRCMWAWTMLAIG